MLSLDEAREHEQAEFARVGYTVAPGMISADLAEIALRYYLSYVAREGYYVVKDKLKALDRYADALSEAMMPAVQRRLEGVSGFSLLPSYSYARIYTTESKLEKHTDRGACEISATMTIGYRNVAKLWPIFLETNGRTVSVDLPAGDALVYRGMDLPHWREPLEQGLWCQVFFHFVQADGTLAGQIYDGRGRMGPLTDEVIHKLASGKFG